MSSEGPAATVGWPEPPAAALPATRLVLSSASRGLRRQLSPVAWAVLEEVALDTTEQDGVLVAATSSRRIAEQLGLAPSTAATALRQLRKRRLLRLEQRSGPAGRFGLAVYTLEAIPGLRVELPCAGSPDAAAPCAADGDAAAGGDDRRSSGPLLRCGRRSSEPDQALLDLGWSGS